YERVMTARDGKIFRFKTETDNDVVSGLVFLVHVPKNPDPSNREGSHGDATRDHLCLEDPTTSENPW
ncbi:hypothetical protein Tco_0123348, partial [Tanacetum coccineum]